MRKKIAPFLCKHQLVIAVLYTHNSNSNIFYLEFEYSGCVNSRSPNKTAVFIWNWYKAPNPVGETVSFVDDRVPLQEKLNDAVGLISGPYAA